MKKEKTEDGSNDENIFDIRAGVAISIFIKYADIYHKEILLRNIYINYNVAVSTERGQIAIDFTKEELLEKLNEFASLEEQTARD
ncbi:hypothetical protein KZ870_39720, partial [Pseudomonas aeruginosa]|nr:hypothetical protein [Pseudomonas aeruginosa]